MDIRTTEYLHKHVHRREFTCIAIFVHDDSSLFPFCSFSNLFPAAFDRPADGFPRSAIDDLGQHHGQISHRVTVTQASRFKRERVRNLVQIVCVHFRKTINLYSSRKKARRKEGRGVSTLKTTIRPVCNNSNKNQTTRECTRRKGGYSHAFFRQAKSKSKNKT